jgi:TRAP-type uncharacterized transport system substrate-binding protein
MKAKFLVGLVSTLIVFISIAVILVSCDFTKPKTKFRLAVPKSESFYDYIADHLKPYLERQGYEISIIHADDIQDAHRLVAQGKADLTMINNHSTTVALELGNDASQLRTVMPLTTRILLVYTKKQLRDSATILELFENKRVGIEFLEGETHLTLSRFLTASKIGGVKFEIYNDSSDVVVFWGRPYGERSARWVEKGFYPYTFRRNFIEFIMLNDHALRSFKLPALPGDANSIITHTLATDVILVANKNLGENGCYLLAQAIYQNKADLMHNDVMYRFINEGFNKETLLFPLHQGTFSYLLRDQPTFFERYAESLALGLSILAVIYGIIQAIQGQLRRSKKERIDKYFLEFLEIRSDKTIVRDDRVKKLDELFQHAVVQLTNEKLDKGDFHILSRLIQQDLTMLRFDTAGYSPAST